MNSKKLFRVCVCFASLLIMISCNNHQATKEKELNALFNKHLGTLDSLSSKDFSDQGFKSIEAIRFLESATGIEGSGDGNIVGKYNFREEDLKKWRDWYSRNKGNLIQTVKDTSIVSTYK